MGLRALSDTEFTKRIHELEEKIKQCVLLEGELEGQLDFERFLSEMSSAFVAASSLEIDGQINRWLANLSRYLKIDVLSCKKGGTFWHPQSAHSLPPDTRPQQQCRQQAELPAAARATMSGGFSLRKGVS